MTCVAQLGLNDGQAVGVDVDQGDVPAILSQDPGGDPADPGRTAGAGDDSGALLRQPTRAASWMLCRTSWCSLLQFRLISR